VAGSDLRQEMAKSRIAKSAKIAELNLDATRIDEEPSITMPGMVRKIIRPPPLNQKEKAQISVDSADRKYRNLRIENILVGENGDDVKLKKGAHVEVSVAAESWHK
jgi:hypothetical protein